MGKRVILSVTNDLVIDQRLHRTAMTLLDMGFEVLVIGRERRGSQEMSPRPYNWKRMKLFFEKGKLFYLEYNLRLFFVLLYKRASIFTANDLDTLLATYLAALLRRKKMIYDAHEYFTGVPELVDRPLSRGVWRVLEKIIVPKLKNISTVNKSLADLFTQQYEKYPVVIRNLPYYRGVKPEPLKSERVLLYQGNINEGRGVDLMLRAMTHLDNVKLLLVGGGDLLTEMQELSQKLGVEQKVEFTGQIPMENLWEYTRQGSIGLSLEDPRSLNSYLCLPNKFLDYIQARVPVIISDLPEPRQILESYNLGVVLEKRDPECLAHKVSQLFSDQERYQYFCYSADKAARDLCWENEAVKIRELYQF